MGRENAEVPLRVVLTLCTFLGACSNGQAPAPQAPTPLGLYRAGRFTEALAIAPPELAARIQYNPAGPSLNNPKAALALHPTPEARLALQPSTREPAAEPLAQLEAQCQAGQCNLAAIRAYRDQHKSELPALIRTGRLLFKLDPQAAGDCVEAAVPIAQALRPPQDVEALHWTAATDELYADLLARNQHHGHARGLYMKALTAYRLWPAQSAHTQGRQRELERKVAALDRILFKK